MSLAEFKGIFWWEYAHRLLGRLIGVAFLSRYVWFALRGAIPPGYGGKLAAIFVLGGLQGALGWYMVQSGLVDDPRVSQFRLTAHLGARVRDLRRDAVDRDVAAASRERAPSRRLRGAGLRSASSRSCS